MWRLINIQRINCAPSWFYLQDYTEMHNQQNIKLIFLYLVKTAQNCNTQAAGLCVYVCVCEVMPVQCTGSEQTGTTGKAIISVFPEILHNYIQ